MRRLGWNATVLLLACNAPSPPAQPVQTAHATSDAGTDSEGARPAGALRPPVGRPANDVEHSPHVLLGVPRDADPSNDLELDKAQFVLSYDGTRSATNWVAWRLRASDLGHMKRSDHFYADELLPASLHHVQPQDYARSGFERGHLCPSGDRTFSHEANVTTFVMTNMQPQTHDLNTGPWEALEAWSRDRVQTSGKDLYIVAGGVFSGTVQKVGPGIAVPAKAFKVIVALDRDLGPTDVRTDTLAFSVLIPNAHGIKHRPWTDYVVPISQVQKETGYDFLSKVPADVQDVVESRVAKVP